jgi:serine protease Do
VNSAAGLDKAASDAAKAGRKAILVRIMRNNNSHFVAVPVGKG